MLWMFIKDHRGNSVTDRNIDQGSIFNSIIPYFLNCVLLASPFFSLQKRNHSLSVKGAGWLCFTMRICNFLIISEDISWSFFKFLFSKNTNLPQIPDV